MSDNANPPTQVVDAKANTWHLDKRVPIALIFALLVQTGGIFWWGGGLDKQVAEQERRITKLESVDDQLTDEMRRIEGRLSSLEANGKAQLSILSRVERILENRKD
jgi:hypothetical protein